MHNMPKRFVGDRLIVAFYLLLLTHLSIRATPVEIPLDSYIGSHRVIRAKMNGQDGVFLFDSGGGITNVTPEFAQKIGRKPWGKIVGFRMTGQRIEMARCDDVTFEIGGDTERLSVIGVFDLMSLIPPGAPKVDGMIALDAFANRIVTIALANNRVIIDTEDTLAERIKHASEEPVRLVRDAQGIALTVDAAVKTRQGLVWMELDTGNAGNIVVADWLADEFGIDPGKKEAQSIRFQLANGTYAEGQVRTRDLILDGNLGLQFLKNWIVTLDLPHVRAWFAPAQP
jgi:predicted aspartyl protease